MVGWCALSFGRCGRLLHGRRSAGCAGGLTEAPGSDGLGEVLRLSVRCIVFVFARALSFAGVSEMVPLARSAAEFADAPLFATGRLGSTEFRSAVRDCAPRAAPSWCTCARCSGVPDGSLTGAIAFASGAGSRACSWPPMAASARTRANEQVVTLALSQSRRSAESRGNLQPTATRQSRASRSCSI